MPKNNKIITIAIIFVFILAFYFLTKNPSTSETNISDPNQTIMPTLAPSKVTQLQIEDTVVGNGQEVKSGDNISIHYSGTLEDGTKFDSSYDRNQPLEIQIGVGQVIQGWDQGVVGMKVGGKRKLTIPYQLAYGENGSGPIPPKATLIFEVELIDIK
ncbi:MAG: FKBP-type peptidyl-prolyl cis-trans isomerase [Candidatus Shapirobacteria bacterium]